MKKKLLFITLLTSSIFYSQTQIGKDINGEAAKDEFGMSVSLSSDGNIIAIGGPNNNTNGTNSGHVRIYRNNKGIWEQIGSDIDGETSFESFGKSVSLSSNGNTIAIGIPYKDTNGDNSGHARVYQNKNGVWTQIGQGFNGVEAGDLLGTSISLSSDGNIVAIGAPNNDTNGTNSGLVRVYQNKNGVWVQIGTDIHGIKSGDEFGVNLNLSSNGNILAIANNNRDNTNSSNVRIFQNNNNTWTQIGSDINTELAGNFTNSRKSLSSLSLSENGNIIAIGSIHHNSGFTHLDYVSIYQNNSGIWEQIGTDIKGEAESDQFGRSVSLSSDGNIIAIGGPMNTSSKTLIHSGHARIYKNINNVWTQTGIDINGRVTNNLLGTSVSLSSDGSVLAIGGPDNNGYDNHLGHVRVFNLSGVLSTNEIIESTTKLYPNPVTNKLTIELKEKLQLKKVTVYNSIGKLILTTTNQIIDVNNLSKGIYFISIVTNKGKTNTKIIIN
ncbi:Por secretion system C-terminal sorting domain-containing protein [Tenacibaculum sp. MAR_2010_89]|uniref:T9SS type A sorting domain-containing protein n=1 Tax=Tenacibaculum sp. MAR_2010_89 TaxID=1250198 RepID=UPI0008961C91|nr:T9SS type A sorting domain-containing protein [Tenacibaculum sp. MAR_2010_89]SEE34653.1 Por secretion system C-terminal sorting domain-containing protein [Tenacibaculum sp. MAR_2010_89]